MKKLSLAVAAAFAIGAAAPATAADYRPAPAPAPMTCMDYVNAHYAGGTHHQILMAPFYVAHSLVCHVFHHDWYYR
jgi:hypothetical protein